MVSRNHVAQPFDDPLLGTPRHVQVVILHRQIERLRGVDVGVAGEFLRHVDRQSPACPVGDAGATQVVEGELPDPGALADRLELAQRIVDQVTMIAYAFESESAIDVDGLAKASKEWRGASVEAVWITKEEEVGTATIEAGTIIDFVPLHKVVLAHLLYASLAMRH